jgi:chromosomal replication initiator protein
VGLLRKHRVVGLWRRCYARPSPGLPRSRRNEEEHPIELTAARLWEDVCERLRGALNETTFQTWFAEAEALELDGDTFSICVPNDFTREWIEGHFLGLIAAAVKDSIGGERQVRLLVAESEPAAPAAADAPAAAPLLGVPATRERDAQAALSTKYTFDSFVIGSSNRFAHAAALAVAEAPAQAYEHQSHLTVKYVTSETFMNDFINSLRDKRIEGFKHRYRSYDLLLIDDVQFFEHKDRLQEEFFHTFNSLYEAGRQIVLSSDRPPREIATLEARLRSRFEWGLITDIQPPDLETRIAILRKKVKTDGIYVPDPEVLTFIAGLVSTNIRELEGALTRVVAFSSLTGRPMTVELAQDVLKDVFPQGESSEVSIEKIQAIISERFGLSLDELCGDKRSQAIVYPRQVAMYLSRELTDSSLPKIGREFGGRDHTTVIHATSKIQRLIREDRAVYNLVQELTARIKQMR